jgi:hypothetical protein
MLFSKYYLTNKFIRRTGMAKEENKSVNNLETAADIFGKVVDKATEKGHKNATLGSGAMQLCYYQ